MNLPKNIAAVRKRWRESLDVFGERFGYSRTTIRRIETGEYEVKAPFLFTLSELSGISMERLMSSLLKMDEIPIGPVSELRAGDVVNDSEGKPVYEKKDLTDILKLVEVVKQMQDSLDKMHERLVYLENKLREKGRPF